MLLRSVIGLAQAPLEVDRETLPPLLFFFVCDVTDTVRRRQSSEIGAGFKTPFTLTMLHNM